jgi:hypothetical protein
LKLSWLKQGASSKSRFVLFYILAYHFWINGRSLTWYIANTILYGKSSL